MAFTKHGHFIPGSTDGGDRPEQVKRCGGPVICAFCARDVVEFYGDGDKLKNMPMINEEYKPSEIMRFFSYGHLPVHLQQVSEPYVQLAQTMDMFLPDGMEKTVALRKLLESKDAAVRSSLDIPTPH